MTVDGPRFDQLNIVVEDMERALVFYERLGFEVLDTLPEWAAHHRTVVSPGGFDVELDSAATAAGWGGVGPGVVVGVRLPSREAVDAAHTALVGEGHASLREPFDAFWGARYAVVRDPDGNAVGLMSPTDPVRHTAPPPPPT